jgi:hypothetical protein
LVCDGNESYFGTAIEAMKPWQSEQNSHEIRPGPVQLLPSQCEWVTTVEPSYRNSRLDLVTLLIGAAMSFEEHSDQVLLV